MQDKWISVDHRLPEPYADVRAKNNDGKEWTSYMYPNETWMNNKKPAFWQPLTKLSDTEIAEKISQQSFKPSHNG